jgi:hypothetical protein
MTIFVSEKERMMQANSWKEVQLEEMEDPDDIYLSSSNAQNRHSLRILDVLLFKEKIII